jgi:hypothetical protein
MKIAMIGPGIMEIPPKNWGAVEILIWDLSEAMRKLGHDVRIFNDPNLYNVAQQINSEPFDFIHLQYDNHAGFLSKNLRQPFCVTSHYGWILQPEMWDAGYRQIFKDMADCRGIIASYIMNLLTAGVPHLTVQQLVGHADYATLKHYTAKLKADDIKGVSHKLKPHRKTRKSG